MIKRYTFLFTILLGLFYGCEKPPIYNDTPTITFERFSSDTIQQGSQNVTFYIGFTDGDGDLGTDEATNNLVIVDLRRGDSTFYRIPPIPRQGVASGISGVIEVDMGQICCIHPDFPIVCTPIENTYDSVEFSIKIKDNAGRWSNEVTTSALRVRCF